MNFTIPSLTSDKRGVSPVIGVILMVAITVILAAVIGTFVLGLGENIQQSPSAGVTVDGDTVTLVSTSGNTDGIYCAGSSGTTATAPGDTLTCDSTNASVVAYIGDNADPDASAVIRTLD